MVPPGQWFAHRPLLTLKFLSGYVHRSTLPQSRIRSTAPSGREPGNDPHNVNHPPAGCCVSGRVIFGGSVWGCVLPFNRVLAKPWGYGRFSSPLRNSKFLHSTIHRSTLPQSRFRSTAPSEREPGGVRTIQRTAQKPEGFGQFSSPLRRLRMFYIPPFIGRHSLTGRGFGCGRRWGFGGRLF